LQKEWDRLDSKEKKKKKKKRARHRVGHPTVRKPNAKAYCTNTSNRTQPHLRLLLVARPGKKAAHILNPKPAIHVLYSSIVVMQALAGSLALLKSMQSSRLAFSSLQTQQGCLFDSQQLAVGSPQTDRSASVTNRAREEGVRRRGKTGKSGQDG
jgi:hypothetical protein